MSYKTKLSQIRAFVFDVDGVFTDGSILLVPGPAMSRVMSVLDGYAVVKALKADYKICIITGGDDPMVRHRMEYLGITDYHAKISDKKRIFDDFINKNSLNPKEILTMGDDLPDMEILRASGIAAAPKNAVPEVKNIADYISPIFGGSGAVRDVIEQVMKVQRKWIPDEGRSI